MSNRLFFFHWPCRTHRQPESPRTELNHLIESAAKDGGQWTRRPGGACHRSSDRWEASIRRDRLESRCSRKCTGRKSRRESRRRNLDVLCGARELCGNVKRDMGEWNYSSEITENLDALELCGNVKRYTGEWSYSGDITENLDALCDALVLCGHVKRYTGEWNYSSEITRNLDAQ